MFGNEKKAAFGDLGPDMDSVRISGAKTWKEGRKKLAEMIREADTIAMSGHTSPDGDCIGACLGLYNYIVDQYPEKTVDIYLEPVPKKFHFLRHADKISQKKQLEEGVYDLYFSLDVSDQDRLRNFRPLFEEATRKICIDHHVTNEGFGDLSFVVPHASSACEVLCELLDYDLMSKECAEALYLGIVHDTGVFRHSNTTGRVMRIAGALIDKGLNSEFIINSTFYEKTYRQNLVMGRALLESMLILDRRMVFSVFRKKDFGFYKVTKADLEGIVSQLKLTEGVEVALFMYQLEDNSYKVSLRSTDKVDVSKIAALFGGGGHKKAAGCNALGEARDIVMSIASYVEQQLDENNTGNSL